MKVNRFLLLMLITVVAIAIVSFVSVRASTQSSDSKAQVVVDDDDSDQPITGSALEKASAAALDYLGEGKVMETEVGDEEGYYEVEVKLGNGRQVDVHLDENFVVLGQKADSD
jgi:uncharacterized membrane protein YkoI